MKPHPTKTKAVATLALATALALLTGPGLRAASTGSAEFTRVINDVKTLPLEAAPQPAEVGDRVTGQTAVATGVQSRAELRFEDKTLTRLGANSVFRMDQETRTAELDRGVILLQVPKQIGGAKVRTAAVTAAVSGTTVIIEFMPDGFIKIIIFEGECDVFLNDRPNQFRTLTAGDMWITRSDDKSGLPLPVQVDLERLKKTSKLMDEDLFSPLGNAEQVQGALDGQAKKLADGELSATSFQIEGRGRLVTLTQGERQRMLGVTEPAAVRRPPPPVVSSGSGGGRAVVVAGPNRPVNVPDSTVFEGGATIRTDTSSTAYNSGSGGFAALPGVTYDPAVDGPFETFMYDEEPSGSGIDDFLDPRGPWWVFKGDEVYISGNPDVDSTGGPRNLLFGATGDVHITSAPPFAGPGFTPGDRWVLEGNIDALVLNSHEGSVVFSDFSLLGTTQDLGFFADGPLSDITITGGETPARISVPGGVLQATAGRDVQVAGATVEARVITAAAGRDVRVGSAEAGGATLAAAESISLSAGQSITISNSSQLRRLTAIDNPQVVLEALAGDLSVLEGSSIDADRAELLAHRGDINLINATLAARDIGARVFDGGGTLLLSNSTLGNGVNPADLIRLYGEGAGGVRFTGLTTLNGSKVDIAGRSVSIDAGSRVRLANPAGTRVFADAHNYNSPSTGAFTGLSGSQGGGGPVEVNRHGFAERPPY